jgi:hypothetical protein
MNPQTKKIYQQFVRGRNAKNCYEEEKYSSEKDDYLSGPPLPVGSSMSDHVATSANENWSAAPKKDATRITQFWDSMLSPPTHSGNGGTQLGMHSALLLLAFNSESVARQKINLHNPKRCYGQYVIP